MGKENVIITGNITANNNQFTSNSGGSVVPSTSIQLYGRVVRVNLSDRSIEYEIIKDNLGTSAVDNPNKITGTAKNFNPNFTRLPEINEIVPLIKGPTKKAGNSANQYDFVMYYMLGPISIQGTVDDNKVPQSVSPSNSSTNNNSNNINSYLANDIGVINAPVPVSPPAPTPSASPQLDPRGTFYEVYTNINKNEFDIFYKENAYGITVYAYQKNTQNLIKTGTPSSTVSLTSLVSDIEASLAFNKYPF
jgi:hypothetical protein